MSAYLEIEHLRTSITALSKTKTRLEEERDSVKKRYEQLDGRLQDIHRTIDALQQELELCAHGSNDFTTPAAVDLSGCETLIERLERIAVANGGALYIPAAREIIFAAGASSATPNHLRSSILKTLKRNPEEWELVGDRTFRYKPLAEQGDAGTRAEDAQPHGAWYNSSNESGATECSEHPEAPIPPERWCPQWSTNSLDYGQGLINQQSPTPSDSTDGPRSRRLSGSLPEPAPDAAREPIPGEATMSAHNPSFPPAPWQGPDGADARRAARGQRIATSTPIAKTENGWTIPSDSRPGVHYHIWTDENGAHCDCPDTLRTCKHIVALQLQLEGQPKGKAVPALASAPAMATLETPPPSNVSTPMLADLSASPDQLTYWQAYNRAQTNEGLLLPRLLHALCALVPEEVCEGRGRPSASVRDLLFGEIMREYYGLSSRRCQTGIRQAAADGYISNPYTHNTGTNFLNRPETTDLLRALITEAARPLRGIEKTFAPDSSGFSTCTYNRWQDDKHSPERTRAHYVKTHIMVGVQSHIITAASASVEPVADITMLRPLLEETRGAQFTVEELTADAAYLSEPMLEWLRETGTDPWIPFRANSRFHYDESIWDKYLATFLLNQELFAEHYHQRSQVETTFSMIKAKYGASVRGKTSTSQANGVLCKLLANNLYVLVQSIYKLGMTPEFAKVGTL